MVQRRFVGQPHARVRVDVAGYRRPPQGGPGPLRDQRRRVGARSPASPRRSTPWDRPTARSSTTRSTTSTASSPCPRARTLPAGWSSARPDPSGGPVALTSAESERDRESAGTEPEPGVPRARLRPRPGGSRTRVHRRPGRAWRRRPAGRPRDRPTEPRARRRSAPPGTRPGQRRRRPGPGARPRLAGGRGGAARCRLAAGGVPGRRRRRAGPRRPGHGRARPSGDCGPRPGPARRVRRGGGEGLRTAAGDGRVRRSVPRGAGGRLLVSDPPIEGDGGADDRWPAEGLALVGLAVERTWSEPFHYRSLVLAEPCPDRYPRRDGIPAKRPLF